MKNYYRVMLGQKSTHAAECFAGSFIGADFGFPEDLSSKLSDEWRTFNHELIPVYLASHPGKSKIAAGLSCGFLWTVAKGIAKGDRVLCPDGGGKYRVGEVSGDSSDVRSLGPPHILAGSSQLIVTRVRYRRTRIANSRRLDRAGVPVVVASLPQAAKLGAKDR